MTVVDSQDRRAVVLSLNMDLVPEREGTSLSSTVKANVIGQKVDCTVPFAVGEGVVSDSQALDAVTVVEGEDELAAVPQVELHKVMDVVVGVQEDAGRRVAAEAEEKLLVEHVLHRDGPELHVGRIGAFKGDGLCVDI